MAKVELYSTLGCKHCRKAKAILNKFQVPYIAVDIENYREVEKTKTLTSDSRKLSSGQNWNSNRAKTAATPTRHTTDNNPKENTNRKTVTTHPPYNYELIQRES